MLLSCRPFSLYHNVQCELITVLGLSVNSEESHVTCQCTLFATLNECESYIHMAREGGVQDGQRCEWISDIHGIGYSNDQTMTTAASPVLRLVTVLVHLTVDQHTVPPLPLEPPTDLHTSCQLPPLPQVPLVRERLPPHLKE